MTALKLTVLGVGLLIAALVVLAATVGAKRRDADHPNEGPRP